MNPLEVRELPRAQELAFITGLGALRLNRVPFYETAWAKRAQPNPFYRPTHTKTTVVKR